MQANKDSLGFIQCGGEAGLGISMAAGRMVVCEIDGLLAGYLSFTETPERVRIQQLVIADAWRRCGLGTDLLRVLRTSRPNVPVSCRVRDDLIANEFWRARGFAVESHATHETSGARLFCYTNPNGVGA
jgi:GNAT superfamily N-acetyltransferase